MSDWFIQQSGFSSDKVLGPLTNEQVVALFIRGEINKKTPLASQQHTSNEWVLIKDSVLWPVVQETMLKEKEDKSRQAAALKQQQEEERQRQEQQHEQERIEAENQRQQQQQLAMQQAAQAPVAQQQVVPVPTGQGQGDRLVTNIARGEISAVLIAGTIIVVVGALSVIGGLILFIVAISNETPSEMEYFLGMAIAGTLYGFLTIGLGAALKVFGRMGQLLEQNTLTLLESLGRDARVKIDSMEERKSPDHELYRETRVEVSLKKVTLTQVVSLLHSIESSARQFSVKGLRIKTRTDQEDTLEVGFTVSSFEAI